MPRKFFKKRGYRKRRRYRRRKSKYSKRRVNVLRLRGVSQIPDIMYCKLKYTGNFSMTNTAGSGFYVYRMNGLYDPDFTGSGHQPLGYDQWSAFYSRYLVYGSKVILSPVATVTDPIRVAVFPSESSAPTFSSPSAFFEQPYGKMVTFGNTTSSIKRVLVNYMSIKKLEGNPLDSLNYSAPIGADPARTLYWQCRSNSLTSGDISSVKFSITIIYYVKFFRRKTQDTS